MGITSGLCVARAAQLSLKPVRSIPGRQMTRPQTRMPSYGREDGGCPMTRQLSPEDHGVGVLGLDQQHDPAAT